MLRVGDGARFAVCLFLNKAVSEGRYHCLTCKRSLFQGRKPHVVNPVFEPYCGRYAVKHGGVQIQILF